MINRASHVSDVNLVEVNPQIKERALHAFLEIRPVHPEEEAGLERQISYLGRVADLSGRILVVGCGAQPFALRFLLERGFDAVGVEPVERYVGAARAYLGRDDRVIRGSCESIPVADGTIHVVYCNSVLEHVDSPEASLREMWRALKPGGVAVILTTNRYRLSLTGDNGEYDVPFLNWFPAVVRECYAFHHLHFAPRLANYSERPAVHWYSYADLCRLGRAAGFAQFYSLLDLVDARRQSQPLRRLLLPRVQRHPWLRALALAFTEYGGMVVMWKRR